MASGCEHPNSSGPNEDRAVGFKYTGRGLLIEFKQIPAAETRDLDDDTVVDLDAEGSVCATTLEHASQRTALSQFSYERVAAWNFRAFHEAVRRVGAAP
jgi:uncharacterized protein YuzE